VFKKKIVIIGVDGATWKVITPLMNRGKLPNLSRLMDNGVSGILTSFEPMGSPILWTSISSGKTPKKHGIGSLLLNSNHVRCKRIWDILEERGWSIGLMGHLLVWPPRKIKGYIIPDDTFSKGIETYPEDLSFIRELAENKRRNNMGIKKYIYYAMKSLQYGIALSTLVKGLKLSITLEMNHSDIKDSFYKIRSLRDRFRSDLFISLDRKYKPDFSFYYTNLTDGCSHLYWKYMKPEKFEDISENEIERYHDVIFSSYIQVDHFLGRLLEKAKEDWIIGVVSDHGFKAASASEMTWDYIIKTENLSELLNISDKTIGYNLGQTAILKFKEKYKDEIKKYSQLIDQITDKETGLNVFTTIIDEYGIHLIVNKRFRDIRNGFLNFPTGIECELKDLVEKTTRINGIHDLEGLFILKGPDLLKGKKMNNASILDITPTLLALLGIPVGKDMDGKVLIDAIKPEFLENHPIQYIDTHETSGNVNIDIEDDEYVEEVKNKLRTLGYIA